MQKPCGRIGVLTGGGDCPGLNAVIRAVTKSAINDHGLEVWGVADGFLGLIENRMHRLDLGAVSNILTRGGTILGTSNRADPSRHRVGPDPSDIRDVTDTVLANVAARGLDGVVCIGGDGTMSGAARLIRRGLPCIGIPKTIDNDIVGTEVAFGFNTAVQTATEALDRIHTTAASHHRVMLVEMMGRNAGWLTLYAGVASGADVILIPEIPYHIDRVCECCARRSKVGKAFTIVAVSEGCHAVGGAVTVKQRVADSPDPIRLGGVSHVLTHDITERTGLVCRATILGHVQRGGTPCAYDRVLATQFGHAAVDLLSNGRWNQLVVMQQSRITSVPIAESADAQRRVPADDPVLAACRALGTCLGD